MGKSLKLNLGSGLRPQPGCVNIDNRPEVNPDIILDITTGLPFPDNSVDRVFAYDILEHIPIGKTVPLIEEIYRVLKPNGVLEHFTPSTDGRGAFQDPDHKSFWNINSWLYFMDDQSRELYGIKAKFRGENQDYRTNSELGVVHTRGLLYAVKEEKGGGGDGNRG